MSKRFLAASFLAVGLALSVGAGDAHAQATGQETQTTGQEVCAGFALGTDVFSVGEVRTSILEQAQFQELNGSEWILMDGRPLLVPTELSSHLLKGEHGPVVPDARGRFLRMANNNACADFRGDDTAYGRCIADHDPNGDRLLGTYQADAFRAHQHDAHLTFYGRIGRGCSGCDVGNVAPSGIDSRVAIPTTGTTGGNETRSKNVAVNFYIKVCNCRTDNCK